MSSLEAIYFDTREVYLGKRKIKKLFGPFVDWFENKYHIHLLNIDTRYDVNGSELDLWFATDVEMNYFCNKLTLMPEHIFIEEIRLAFHEIMTHKNFKNRLLYFPPIHLHVNLYFFFH
jgi:hypothetical protein